jgi:hypothetical protein
MSATAAPSIGERLKACWLAQGLVVRPGVSTGAIQTFEARYQVRLPEDLRDYFAVVNGTGQYSYVDDNGFCFWSLEEMKPLSEQWPGESFVQGPDSCFLFADHLIWCPAYAIRLSPKSAADGEVLAIYSDNMKFDAHRVVNSFTQFVEEYFAHGVVL